MDELLIELTRRYTEPHRRYHDLRHIADMLLKGRGFPLSDEQVMAVWFHDAIYDPASKTNEIDSAELAVERLFQLGWEGARVKVVQQIVLDTKGHTPSIEASKPVLDLDLSTLAGSWEDYARNGANIRAEYASVPEADWLVGRRKWLESMLAKPALFHTDWGKGLESHARRNLARDLSELGNS